MGSIAVRGQRSGVRFGLPKQGRFRASSILVGDYLSMSTTSCGKRREVKSNKQSDCGARGASQQPVSAEVYAAPPAGVLRNTIRGNDVVLAYVVRTCGPKPDGSGASVVLEHTGSGPNMAGGRITLCTCKHRMRSSPVFWDDDLKSNIWIAGFSSSSFDGKNWLYYLMKVDQKFDSQRAIYEYLTGR